MFDADPRAFGAVRLRNAAGEGRFGPVFTAVDDEGRPVVVRTIRLPLTEAQREALLEAFAAACEAPLDHPGILKPLSSGLSGETPYIVHAWGAGESLESRLAREGALPPDVLLPPLTRAAAAIDFAAAAGIHHGMLTAADIYVGDEQAAVAGFGIAQALAAASVDIEIRSDIEALARIAYAALGDPPLRLEVPDTALGFVAGFQADHSVPPPEADHAAPPPEQVAPRRSGWPLSRAVAVALLGAAVGVAAGYVARDVADGAQTIPAPAPTATSGSERPEARGGNGATVRQSNEPRGPATETPEIGPARPMDIPPPGPTEARATLEVASRPLGAQVFVDGRLIGTTPLRQDIAPGAHAVRLVLPAHRPWVTRVDVGRGEQVRVAGSLER